jgi:hypothetical protein
LRVSLDVSVEVLRAAVFLIVNTLFIEIFSNWLGDGPWCYDCEPAPMPNRHQSTSVWSSLACLAVILTRRVRDCKKMSLQCNASTECLINYIYIGFSQTISIFYKSQIVLSVNFRTWGAWAVGIKETIFLWSVLADFCFSNWSALYKHGVCNQKQARYSLLRSFFPED